MYARRYCSEGFFMGKYLYDERNGLSYELPGDYYLKGLHLFLLT